MLVPWCLSLGACPFFEHFQSICTRVRIFAHSHIICLQTRIFKRTYSNTHIQTHIHFHSGTTPRRFLSWFLACSRISRVKWHRLSRRLLSAEQTRPCMWYVYMLVCIYVFPNAGMYLCILKCWYVSVCSGTHIQGDCFRQSRTAHVWGMYPCIRCICVCTYAGMYGMCVWYVYSGPGTAA